jgi:proteasome component ECM29
MPFVYIAKRDLTASIAENFEKSWSENGSSGSVRLYLPEIVKLIEKYLPSQRWSVRQSAALALAESVKDIGRDLSAQQAELLYPTFVKSLEGKSWSGKENVLKGFSDLLVKSPAILENKSNEVKKVSGLTSFITFIH